MLCWQPPSRLKGKRHNSMWSSPSQPGSRYTLCAHGYQVKKIAPKPDMKGVRLPWWLAWASEHSDIQKCWMKPAQSIKTGLSSVSNISGLMTNGNGVVMTRAWRAEVAVRMCTLNLAGNSNDSWLNCSFGHTMWILFGSSPKVPSSGKIRSY